MDTEQDQLRLALKRYIAEKGHGSITALSEKINVTRVTLYRFLQGAYTSRKTARKVKEEVAPWINAKTAPSVQGDLIDKLSRELLGLSEALTNPLTPGPTAANKFKTIVEVYYNHRDVFSEGIIAGKEARSSRALRD